MLKKDSSIKISVLAVLVFILGLSGCLSRWQGDLAKIVIPFTGAGRAAYNPEDNETHQQLDHRIVLANKRETLNFRSKGMETFEAWVTPGNWTVWVYSWLEDDIYAAGTGNVNLQIGQENVITIIMQQAHLVKFISNGGSAVPDQVVIHNKPAVEPSAPQKKGSQFNGWYADSELREHFNFNETIIIENITLYAKWTLFITEIPGNNLAEKLNWLNQNAVDGGNYIINVADFDSVDADHNFGYDTRTISLTLSGGMVSLNNAGIMFNIGSKGTLILENIILIGLGNNIGPLIFVNGGTLIMNEGAVVTGNTSDGSNNYGISGGGVCIGDSGNFIMNGGTISNNKYGAGGGVHIWGGVFEMNGGEISGNAALDSFGGGVIVLNSFDDNEKKWHDGIFNMKGGTISGNTAQSSGGGVSIQGTFTKSGGTITGYANDTTNGNVVKDSSGAAQENMGHAVGVLLEDWSLYLRRESTAGSGVNLSYNGTTLESGGDWEN